MQCPARSSEEQTLLFLTRREVESLLDLDQLIEGLASAMIELSAGRVSMPARPVVEVAAERGARGLLAAMPVYLKSARVLATKLVTLFPENEARDIPTHQAAVLIFDSETGTPLAVMDGASITAIRTACGSALATRHLARPEASTMAILGSGVQARAHTKAIPLVRRIERVMVWSRTPAKAKALADEIASRGIAADISASREEALRSADIVCATTHSSEPVVAGECVAPGTHINSVGLNGRGREVDEAAVLKSSIFVESREAALAASPSGANDLLWPIQRGLLKCEDLTEVGEILTGRKPGRTAANQITLYKSVGVAVQDAVAAQLVLDAARARGMGREFSL